MCGLASWVGAHCSARERRRRRNDAASNSTPISGSNRKKNPEPLPDESDREPPTTTQPLSSSPVIRPSVTLVARTDRVVIDAPPQLDGDCPDHSATTRSQDAPNIEAAPTELGTQGRRQARGIRISADVSGRRNTEEWS